MTFGRFMNSVFRGPQTAPAVVGREPEAAQTPDPASMSVAATDDAQAAAALDALSIAVRAAGRDLPTLLTSRLGQVVDLLHIVSRTIVSQGASTEQRVLLAAMCGDYVPTPLRAFLALPEADRADDSRATALFAEQLGLLEETIRDLLNQIRTGAIAELSTHGRFLADKFQAPDAGLTLGGR